MCQLNGDSDDPRLSWITGIARPSNPAHCQSGRLVQTDRFCNLYALRSVASAVHFVWRQRCGHTSVFWEWGVQPRFELIVGGSILMILRQTAYCCSSPIDWKRRSWRAFGVSMGWASLKPFAVDANERNVVDTE